jgi:uncharacterized protein Veg
LAATKISALTTDAAPHRANDYVPTYDASAVATKKVALKELGRYELLLGFANSSPADSTTYYFGSYINTTLQTTDGGRRVYITRTGIIAGVYMTVLNSGTAGTAEISSVYIRKNSTSNTLLFSDVVTNGAGIVYGNATGTNIAVTAGDTIEIMWVTPAWVTNPTGLYMSAQIIVE